uniref:Uncharacterized protein n=1 Tax=Oncorhynchus tshawytscha TaxID=74940 RepID=A0AAZ3QDB4_ONCTS
MDCVVTMTTVAAWKIYNDTQGRQQAMPLDTVFWRNNNSSSRPLPHIRNGQARFLPIRNPVFARDLLIFQENAEGCQMGGPEQNPILHPRDPAGREDPQQRQVCGLAEQSPTKRETVWPGVSVHPSPSNTKPLWARLVSHWI